MATPPLSNEKLIAAMAAFREAGTIAGGARLLGMNEHTFRHQVEQARERGFVREQQRPADADAPIEELLERMTANSVRQLANAQATALVRVMILVEGPFGLFIGGDPHVDSPHTNWVKLRSDVEAVQSAHRAKVPIFATNLGDTEDNWSGKLQALWAGMDISHRNAKKLATWYLKALPWLIWLRGNHDLWSGPGDLLTWLSTQYTEVDADWSQRIELVPPVGRVTRIGAYHGLRGQSFWMPSFGANKQARLGPFDHIVTGGHTHKGQITYPIVDPATLEWCHAIQVASYKMFPDAYGKRLGNQHECAFPSCVAIINPLARDPANHVHVVVDVQEGIEILKSKRKRWAQARPADV